ncbi:hypothetical protein [Litorihabitans aurantiacus]|uniref:UDP-N-acetylmuramyl pentapeptide phosphotransferase/UDP-N-acetylglucosamine-1-phosphate transferase n=1 Tax=Litorihabitans aurantiacus TaxID=1930061 RepID=A0AA38CTV1_9MICO|nr:hypothetical protein [Litorihabitans aurantiacus]GMA31645.1 hypothetical protein GCM10025875_16370 [Litorihabitans aurantiacus]
MNSLLSGVHAAAWTVGAAAQARRSERDSWRRTNFRGRSVSLAGGLATATGALAGTVATGGAPALAGGVAVAAAGGLGALDDLTERPDDRGTKGLRGHLGALARGTVTTGAVKLVGITAASLVAGAVLATDRRDRRGTAALGTALDAVTSGALVAGTANLLNLLDLRPGRALKATALLGGPLVAVGGPGAGVAAAAVGAAVAAAPSDLAETTMLGDTGANALGAALGVALASRGPVVRSAALAVVVAGTLASERVSFSRVIDRQPVLARIDAFGRLPADAPADPHAVAADAVAPAGSRDAR